LGIEVVVETEAAEGVEVVAVGEAEDVETRMATRAGFQ